MIQLAMDQDNVKEIKIRGKVDYLRHKTFGDKYDHKSLAEELSKRDYSYASVLMTRDWLNEKLEGDPKYQHITHHVLVSQVRYEARKILTNKYFDRDKMEEIFKEQEYPLKRWNYKEEEEYKYDGNKSDRPIRFVIEDEIFNAQEEELFPGIIEGFKDQYRYKFNEEDGDYEYDDEGEPIELPKEEFEKIWEKEKWQYFLPRTQPEYHRVMHINEPFSWWDYRNPFQQWFFIYDKKEDKTYYVSGGSGSSGQREDQGRWANTFMTLSKKYNIKIPTYILFYDEFSKMKLEKRHEDFYTTNMELSGNYWVEDRSEMKDLFWKRLYYWDSKSRKLVFKDDIEAY